MHVFIPVFFRAPLGGLQSHVRAQAAALLERGHRCTVQCRPGPFAGALRGMGVTVLETDFEDVAAAVEQVERARLDIDLVHAHPFRGREVGVELASLRAIPLVVTFHGKYLDSLPRYAALVDAVLTVSPAIRDHLAREAGLPAEQIQVMPNGVDTAVFSPGHRGRGVPALVERFPALAGQVAADGTRLVGFVSRLDEDKQFVLDVVGEAWDQQAAEGEGDVAWIVAGDGALRGAMEAIAARLDRAAGRRRVFFLGWQDEPALAELYRACHVAVAPGRGAMEAMACETATIAIGSKGYVGLIDEARAELAAYGNFGGHGDKHADYTAGRLRSDIAAVIRDDAALAALGDLSSQLIARSFRQRDLDEQLVGLYAALLAGRPRCEQPGPWRELERPALRITSGAWTLPDDPRLDLHPGPDGGLAIACRDLDPSTKVYATSGRGSLREPPRAAHDWRLEPGGHYRVKVAFAPGAAAPTVQAWAIEYSDAARVTHTTRTLRAGENALFFIASPESRWLRIALRFAGDGTATLSPITLWRRGPSPQPP